MHRRRNLLFHFPHRFVGWQNEPHCHPAHSTQIPQANTQAFRTISSQTVWASVHAIRALGKRLTNDGTITFISGTLSDRPSAHGAAVLAAASTAMEALARRLAPELASTRFNTLSPGPIDTPFSVKRWARGVMHSWRRWNSRCCCADWAAQKMQARLFS